MAGLCQYPARRRAAAPVIACGARWYTVNHPDTVQLSQLYGTIWVVNSMLW